MGILNTVQYAVKAVYCARHAVWRARHNFSRRENWISLLREVTQRMKFHKSLLSLNISFMP